MDGPLEICCRGDPSSQEYWDVKSWFRSNAAYTGVSFGLLFCYTHQTINEFIMSL